eukprot:TRINITY_DN13946_c0_g1_i1.p1 TRINITY_DN13946_c0_g1~~TRINITY_DN13946_c0_g1_i1.p1  ORF type:complete len:462 (-),score=116.63 TRINITY_DN13946_c0_g1_i1:26-1297(-)
MRVAVMVLGDVGRSPRMQYHALSLANNGKQVDLIGYKGSDCRPEIVNHPSISIRLLDSAEEKIPNVFRKFFASRVLLRAFIQLFQLLHLLLFVVDSPDYLLVQTPPAIPALPVAFVVRIVKGTKLVFDWHNFGYTLLRQSKKHFIIWWTYKMIEFSFGRLAHANFCVTQGMRSTLKNNWNINAKVLYDKPPSFFGHTSADQRKKLLNRYKNNFSDWGIDIRELNGNGISQGKALLVSSTSWTPDEDFGILFQALKTYNERAIEEKKNSKSKSPTKIVLVVTGKGEQKEYYERLMKESKLEYVKMMTLWLKSEDYPTFLGSADLGVCLHSSSSGLDLPMKVVDMFGATLPVCAVQFECLPELVKHGENGYIFEDQKDLAEKLYYLLNDPKGSDTLDSFRGDIVSVFLRDRWESNWNTNALPVFV